VTEPLADAHYEPPGVIDLHRKRSRANRNQPDANRPEWMQFLLRDDKGNALPNLANAALAMRQAPELSAIVAFDEMARAVILRRAVPKSRQNGPRERCCRTQM
jgi:hypothetical protein